MSTAKSSVGNILLNIQTSRLPKAKNEREVPSTSHLRRIKRQTQQNVKGNWRSKYFAAKKSVQHQIIKSNAPKHSLSDVNTVIPLGNGLKKDMNNQSLIKLNNENGQNDKLYQLEKLDNVSNESSKSFFNSQKRYRDKEDMTSQNDENINRKKVALNCRIKDKFLQKKSDSQASKNQGFISCVFGPKEFQNESKNIISNSNDELKPQNAPAVASKIKSESNLSESNSFENLGLLPSICDHLRDKMSLKKPTSIQLKAVPKILIKNKSMDHDGDFLLQSKTGSGKTLAYLLPLLQNIITLCSAPMGHPVTRAIGGIALILAPTRELANQIYSVADLLLKAKYPNHWIVSGLCNGGDKRKNEKSRFRKGVNIIVGTPGRVLDHLENTKALQLSYLRWIIFDEADKISELGFEPTVKKILALVAEKEKFKQDNNNFIPPNIWPDKCTHILCSATMSKGMNSMAGCPLRNTMFIKDDYLSKGNKLNESAIIHHIPVELVQNFLLSPPKLRFISLIALLNQAIFQAKTLCPKIIIFVSCCDSVNFHYEAFHQMQQHIKLKDIICNLKCKFFKLHGDLLQKDRTAACHMFRNIKHQPAVLISTDVASRGLDLTGVTHIFQYDAPFDVKDYIHRIGRTARSGSGGIATLFLMEEEKEYISILNLQGLHDIQSLSLMKTLQNGFQLNENEEKMKSNRKMNCVWKDRAASFQLLFESMVLQNNELLQLARKAFTSHLRAYTTHSADVKRIFHIKRIHTGHLAKSFGLRDIPSNIHGSKKTSNHNKDHKSLFNENQLIKKETALKNNSPITHRTKLQFNNSTMDEFEA